MMATSFLLTTNSVSAPLTNATHLAIALDGWTVRQDMPAEVTFHRDGLSNTWAPFQTVRLDRVDNGTTTRVFRGFVVSKRYERGPNVHRVSCIARDYRWMLGYVAPFDSAGLAIPSIAAGMLPDVLREFFTTFGARLTAFGLPNTYVAGSPMGQLYRGMPTAGALAPTLDMILSVGKAVGWHWRHDAALNRWEFYKSGTNGAITISAPMDFTVEEGLDGRLYKLHGALPFWSSDFVGGAMIELTPGWGGETEAWNIRRAYPFGPDGITKLDAALIYRAWNIPGLIPADPDAPYELLVQEFEGDDVYSAEIAWIQWPDASYQGQVCSKAPLIRRRVSKNNFGKVGFNMNGVAKRPYKVWLKYSTAAFSSARIKTCTGGTANSLYGWTGEQLIALDVDDDDTELSRQHDAVKDVAVSGQATIPGLPPVGLKLGTAVTLPDGLPGSCTGWTWDAASNTTTVTLSSDRG